MYVASNSVDVCMASGNTHTKSAFIKKKTHFHLALLPFVLQLFYFCLVKTTTTTTITTASLTPTEDYWDKPLRWLKTVSSNYDKHDKMQIFAKFRKLLWGGFRATLTIRKFKVALNPLHIIFFKLCKKLHLIMLIITR